MLSSATLAAVTPGQATVSYSYDGLLRPSDTTCPQSGTQTGNILSYDSAGQLGSWQNAPSNPTTTATDLYDGAGHRVQQAVTSGGTTTTTTYVGSLEEVSTTGATTTTTAYYGGLALSVNVTLSYTLSDALGSVSAALSTEGVVTATQLYGPYGAVRYQSGTLPGTLGYTGQHADAAIGLDYYGARYYDPVAGQFTSADTTLAAGLNRYAYVGGNPESSSDPSGHQVFTPEREIGAGGDTGPGIEGEGVGGGGSPPLPSVNVTLYSDASVVTLDGGMAVTVFAGAAIAVSVGVYTNYNRQRHQASTSTGSGPDNSAFIHQTNAQTGANDTPPPPSPPPTPEHETISISTDESPTPQPAAGGAGCHHPLTDPCRPRNDVGAPYPFGIDLRTGQEIPFPSGDLQRIPSADRVVWDKVTRGAYIKEWLDRGYAEPPGGWKPYDIHHILPKEFGGTNDFWNSVPLLREVHNGPAPEGWTAWWDRYCR